jgi:protein ImuB
MRRIVSLFLPRFTTERLIHIRPDWRDRPFAVVAIAGSRREIVAVSRAALQTGIAPGLALADARAMLPSLMAVDADPAADRRALAALAEWCGRYAPWVAMDGAAQMGGGAGLLLDVTGCTHLFGGEDAMLAEMTARIGRLGLAARAAMAATPAAARALARWAGDAHGFVIAGPSARETATALAALPAAALGLAPEVAGSLSMLGLRTIGQLYGLPRAALAARFGEAVTAPLDRALGRVFEPISPDPPPARHVVRLAFAEPIGRSDDIAAALDRLLDALCDGLRRAGDGARRLILALYEPDGRTRHVRLGLSQASRDAAHVARLFAPQLEALDAAFGFDAMTLAATETAPLDAHQLAAATDPTAANDDAPPAALIDALAGRLGEEAVTRWQARESHMPERGATTSSALAPASLAAVAFAPPGAPARPLRLLARPEPVDAVALLPHEPPALFRWRRVAHRVVRAEGPERIAPEWWREGSDAAAEATVEPRDYWRLEDERGGRFWLYRRERSWFVHGVYG